MATQKSSKRKRDANVFVKLDDEAFPFLDAKYQALSALFQNAELNGGFDTEEATKSALTSCLTLKSALQKYHVQQKFKIAVRQMSDMRVAAPVGRRYMARSARCEEVMRARLWWTTVDVHELSVLQNYLLQHVTFNVEEGDDDEYSEVSTMGFPDGTALVSTFYRNSAAYVDFTPGDAVTKKMVVIEPLTGASFTCKATDGAPLILRPTPISKGATGSRYMLQIDRLAQLRALTRIPMVVTNELFVRTVLHLFMALSQFYGCNVADVVDSLAAGSDSDEMVREVQSVLHEDCALTHPISDIILSLLQPYISNEVEPLVSTASDISDRAFDDSDESDDPDDS